MLSNSTQLPALLLAVFTCLSSIPTNISMSENLCPPAGIVQDCGCVSQSNRCLCWAQFTSAQSDTLGLCLPSFQLILSSFSCFPFRSQDQKPPPSHLQRYRSIERKQQAKKFHSPRNKLSINKLEKVDFLKLDLLSYSQSLCCCTSVCLTRCLVLVLSSWSSPPPPTHQSFHAETSPSGPIG